MQKQNLAGVVRYTIGPKREIKNLATK